MELICEPDLSDARLRPFSSMTDAELRDGKQLLGLSLALKRQDAWAPNLDDGLFVAESRNVIDRALGAGLVPFAALVEQCWLEHERPVLEAIAAATPVAPLFVLSRPTMAALTGFERTRGALAAFARPTLPDVADLLEGARRVAVLEDVTNYTNIGALFRSAAALGMDAVLITPRCHDPLYRRAARVSMGTVFQVPWTRIGDESPDDWAATGLDLLRRCGFSTAAMALRDDALDIRDPQLRAAEKLAVILGTEGDGLSPTTIAGSDWTVRIPMAHGVDSLNVAAAGAVAFWELSK